MKPQSAIFGLRDEQRVPGDNRDGGAVCMYCVHDRPLKSCELGTVTIGRFDTTCSTTAESLLSCTTVLLPLLIARAAIAGCGGSMYPHYRLIGPEEHACYAEQALSYEGKIAKRSHILGYAPRTAVFLHRPNSCLQPYHLDMWRGVSWIAKFDEYEN